MISTVYTYAIICILYAYLISLLASSHDSVRLHNLHSCEAGVIRSDSEWFGFSLKSDIVSWKNWLQVKGWQQGSFQVSEVNEVNGLAPQGFHHMVTPGTRLINLDPSPYHPNVVQWCLGWRLMSNPSELGWIWYVRLRFWSQFGIGRSRFTCNVVRRVGLEPLFIPTFHTLGWDVSEQKRF